MLAQDQEPINSSNSIKSVAERYQQKNFVGSSHAWAHQQLDQIDKNIRVLDIGPAMGLMGEYLKKKGVKELYAVEIDAETRARITEIYTQVEATIDPFKDKKFDLVLMLDVLEHMTDPFEFLESLMPMLADDASILISLPNVAHWSVRLPLLFGVFNYYDRGIQDRTHYQWFTRKRAKDLIKATGKLRIDNESSSIEPIEFILPRFIWNNFIFEYCSKLRVKLAELLPGFFAYQHLLKCKKIK
ncbi:MAG: class I SAM-dependent methyltransferase [Bdellovibrionales bacterium]|nr:class I SAM-dependent methyltransferase [Bdellovibrionales bacterium]